MRDEGTPESKRHGAAAPTEEASRVGGLSSPTDPLWRGDAGGSATGSRAEGGDSLPTPGSDFSPFSQDLMVLRYQVAARCAAARDYREPDSLAAVVAELYSSAVDPAYAVEALILGDCGSVESIVRELVGQGGYRVVGPVTSRASLLAGPGAQRGIEAAAIAGLELAREISGASPQAPDPGAAAYAMAHFSARSGSATLTGADALNTLYGNAAPGFGLYTFVLFSAGSAAQGATERARSRELLRVIETYVPVEGSGGPSPEVHAFLVAVHPGRQDQPLGEQTGPELSDPMRRQLATELRDAGLGTLARRLETRPGPFLISSPEPRLLADGVGLSRLVVDLSGVGNEYLYAIVDAFDRTVPAGAPAAGLDAIEERLLALPLGPDPSGRAGSPWVFRIGRAEPSRVFRR